MGWALPVGAALAALLAGAGLQAFAARGPGWLRALPVVLLLAAVVLAYVGGRSAGGMAGLQLSAVTGVILLPALLGALLVRAIGRARG